MKKIPTLFKREYENHKVVGITPELSSPDLLSDTRILICF